MDYRRRTVPIADKPKSPAIATKSFSAPASQKPASPPAIASAPSTLSGMNPSISRTMPESTSSVSEQFTVATVSPNNIQESLAELEEDIRGLGTHSSSIIGEPSQALSTEDWRAYLDDEASVAEVEGLGGAEPSEVYSVEGDGSIMASQLASNSIVESIPDGHEGVGSAYSLAEFESIVESIVDDKPSQIQQQHNQAPKPSTVASESYADSFDEEDVGPASTVLSGSVNNGGSLEELLVVIE